MGLWVVQPPGRLTAFDPASFASVVDVPLPRFAFSDPARLSVNARGEVLARVSDDSAWVWTGRAWKVLHREPRPAYAQPGPGLTGSCSRQWFLGAEGNSLFLLETSSVVWSGDDVDSARNAARMEETDFDLATRRVVFELPYERCEDSPPLVAMTTPCSEAGVWAPGGVVDDWFVLSRDTTYQRADESSVAQALRGQWRYLRDGSGWRRDSLYVRGGAFADRGSSQIEIELDDGCCGWSNESSDVATLTRNGEATILFDEWARFGNRNYDIGFFPDPVLLAPGGAHVAFTVRTTGYFGEPIRESSDGTPDSVGLASIRRTLAELPVAEVEVLLPKPTILLHVPHAEVVGWLDEREMLLLADGGRLLAADVKTGRVRPTGIRLRSVADVIAVPGGSTGAVPAGFSRPEPE